MNCVIFFLFLHQSLALADVWNRIVAKVNDEVITLHELNEEIKKLTGVDPDDLERQNNEKYLETRRRVLDFMIDKKIANDKISELGINVTDKDVDKAIEVIKKDHQLTQGQLLVKLKKDGFTYESWRENIKTQIERSRLLNYEVESKIIITEEQLREYYDKHSKEFNRGEKVHLATILLRIKNPQNQNEVHAVQQKMRLILKKICST